MKLRTKISAVFAVALIINVFVIVLGLTSVLDSLSSMMMKKQAENLTQFLQHSIIEAENGTDTDDAVNMAIEKNFKIAKHIADESKGFDMRKILLINKNYTVQVGYPQNETGKSYKSHEDIRDAFVKKGMETVIEIVPGTESSDGKPETDIDVVSYFTLKDGSQRVIEVKLDFAKSVSLLEAQYTRIETGAIIVALLLLIFLLSILLTLMGRTAIRPVIRVTKAMERVGSGDLEVRLPEDSRDEFGMLARRFNEMVSGLKEKLQLYKYVSQGTIDAVKGSLSGDGAHATERKKLVIFFSDIRGFTSYSESRDPADVVNVLNKILSLQSVIIHKHGGDIDKFVGDEVMATFTDLMSALNASIEIQKEMAERRPELDMLQIGIGIYEGEVVQGDIGSEETKDYTVIGDSVNTAARLQSAARGGEVLVSQDIAGRDEVKAAFTMELRGTLKLKGKEQLMKAFIVKEPV